MTPNVSEEKIRKRNEFVSQKFFLTIPHFDEIENVYELLNKYKNKTLKPQDLKFFKDKVQKIKYIKGWKKGMAEYSEYSTDPASRYGFHSLKDFAVVLETHTQDEAKGKHLHIYIEFEKIREISDKHFDFLGKHGHLQKVKSEIAVLEYMQKESEIKASFDVLDRLIDRTKSNSDMKKLMFHLIVDRGWQASDITNRFGSRILEANFRQLVELAEQTKADRKRSAELDWMKSNRMRKITPELIQKRLTPEELFIFNHFPIYQELIDVINRILVKGNNHDHKSCTISLVGKPSIGKTTLVNHLSKYFLTYFFPLDNWHKSYTNGLYDMWCWHEWDFRIISVSDFLLLTEGEICDLRVKFAKAKKEDRPLLWLLSNQTFAEQTKEKLGRKPELRDKCLAALNERIQEFDFGNLSLHFLTKLLVSVNEDI